MLLSDLLRLCSCSVLSGSAAVEVSGITSSTAKVAPGNVFVALPGRNSDGHDFVQHAANCGASAVIVSKNVKVIGCTVVYVSDTHKALALLSAAYYGYPQNTLVTVGITGTNGKTTVASILRHILSACGKKCAMCGTVECVPQPLNVKADNFTTPEPPELFAFMRKAADEGYTHFVTEVSSQALDQKRTYGIEFDLGVFTNISEDHLDYHLTMSRYIDAKMKLFDTSSSHLVNIDDANAYRFLGYPRTMTFSCSSSADFAVSDIETLPSGNVFTFTAFGESVRTSQKLRGAFNVSNAAAAIGAAVMLGVPVTDAVRAAESFEGVKGRLEFLETGADYDVIIDYAHTPDGLEKLLDAVEDIRARGGKTILVFGCGGNRDREKRPIMGRIAAAKADIAIVTSDNPRTEDPRNIITDILSGITDSGVVVIEDRRKAIEYALCIARAGDTVVLAGKGHETYMDAGTGRIPFDERMIIKEYFSSQQRKDT